MRHLESPSRPRPRARVLRRERLSGRNRADGGQRLDSHADGARRDRGRVHSAVGSRRSERFQIAPQRPLVLLSARSHLQIRCVVWNRDQRGIAAPPDDGMQIAALGRLTVYPTRGEMQFAITRMEAEGDGLRRKALEITRARLEADGLLARAANARCRATRASSLLSRARTAPRYTTSSLSCAGAGRQCDSSRFRRQSRATRRARSCAAHSTA